MLPTLQSSTRGPVLAHPSPAYSSTLTRFAHSPPPTLTHLHKLRTTHPPPPTDTYPDALFATVADWVRANPSEIVTLYLIVTHGNPSPSSADIVGRLRATGLLDHVWNPDPSVPWGALPSTTNPYPTLGEMRKANKTVMLAGVSWGPPVAGTHVNSTGIANAGETCEGGTPCMEGWDAVVFSQLDASNAILTAGQKAGGLTNASLVMIENLSSRRGRAADNAKYWPLPNLATDLPFQFGGNPAQASLAAGKGHVLALEAAWAQLLKPLSGSPVPNIILVDFFNTSTPKAGVPSRTLIANDMDGLVAAVGEINQARHEARREARWEARRERDATTTVHDTKPWANGCDDGGSGGCGAPVGPKWDTWSMASSTYTYCYGGCVVDWFANNTKTLGLPTYGEKRRRGKARRGPAALPLSPTVCVLDCPNGRERQCF